MKKQWLGLMLVGTMVMGVPLAALAQVIVKSPPILVNPALKFKNKVSGKISGNSCMIVGADNKQVPLPCNLNAGNQIVISCDFNKSSCDVSSNVTLKQYPL
jgi:hypothetical protein